MYKIEPFVHDKSDASIDTKLTQYLDKCRTLGDCADEEKTKKTSLPVLPDEFGTVPPEKPDLEPFIDDPLDPESDTKLEQFQDECRIKFGRIAHTEGCDGIANVSQILLCNKLWMTENY